MKNTSNNVCPVWLAYTFLLPLRKFQHDPQKILSPYIKEGMSVMDYGCAMGWFSIPMAGMIGSHGKVYCVDLQAKMLEKLNKRAVKFNVDNVIQTKQVGKDYNPDELIEKLDFVLLFAVVHEVPDKEQLFCDLFRMLKPGGKILFAEPKGHVCQGDFEKSINIALKEGLKLLPERPVERGLSKLLIKE